MIALWSMPLAYASMAYKGKQEMPTRRLLFEGRRYKPRMMKEEDKPLAAAVGRRLLWVRLLTGKTQEEMVVGRAAQGQYSRWETGERLLPVQYGLEVCRRMQVSLDYIYRGHLIGVNPDLAQQLLKNHPEELVLPPIYTGWHKDTDPP